MIGVLKLPETFGGITGPEPFCFVSTAFAEELVGGACPWLFKPGREDYFLRTKTTNPRFSSKGTKCGSLTEPMVSVRRPIPLGAGVFFGGEKLARAWDLAPGYHGASIIPTICRASRSIAFC